jgi:DNA-binding transcriptional LysR family regulator
MQDLDELRAFLEVARLGSFGRAAAALHLSKSVVSRRVARLEAALGAQLLNRTTRSVAPTEQGLRFAERAERALAQLDAARESVRGDGEVDGLLRIAAPLSFGPTHLAPVIAGLALRHPKLRIHTSYSDRRVDLLAERYDVAIRLGTLADSTLVARRIAEMHGAVVAAPAYLARYGEPRTLADLAKHDVLIEGGRTTWPLLDGGRRVNVPVHGRFDTDSGEATAAAAVAGLGIAMLPTFLVGEHIAAGRLVRILRQHAVPTFGMYVVRPPPPGPAPRKIQALTDILLEHFGGEQTWDLCQVHRKAARGKKR